MRDTARLDPGVTSRTAGLGLLRGVVVVVTAFPGPLQ